MQVLFNITAVAVIILALLLQEVLSLTPQARAEDKESEKTEWQIRFAEHFSDEVVVTDHSYTSPNISINIKRYKKTIQGNQQVWYVADIYIASLDCLRSYAHDDSFDRYVAVHADKLSKEAKALVAINGDFCGAQRNNMFYVRNGKVYQKKQTNCDICVLYNDGTMETYSKKGYKVSDVIERGAYQVWKFGPRLLDSDGKAKTKFNASLAIKNSNPRSAIGYYEPGHYCFVTVDGRKWRWSRGMTLQQLAQVFEDLGCKEAYNLDGGASATMTFMGERYNKQSSYRKISDIIMIGEPN